MTSVHVLNETVLLFFEAYNARVYSMLSDSKGGSVDALAIIHMNSGGNWMELSTGQPRFADPKRWLCKAAAPLHC